MDNIYFVEEIMRGYTIKRGSPRCTVKIDLQKSYDTVDWSVLRDVLSGLNIHPSFIHLIMECVTSPSYTITVNGSHHGYFRDSGRHHGRVFGVLRVWDQPGQV
ncbi:uncharacterized protein LOC125192014 [Salvia hispanica]|uniref:uncharacterized protein LOC125192014 n=1 Tax=Salvia hispanica TaxID=49212 RepID=UPI00200952F9|nr:uncharacterized protein LOC125192014 [Salvia hispanica]